MQDSVICVDRFESICEIDYKASNMIDAACSINSGIRRSGWLSLYLSIVHSI